MNNHSSIQTYYRLHSKIYDATRWTFLFGRNGLIQEIAARKPATICEIGCGTGINLSGLLEILPDAALTGYDISADMIGQARKRLPGEVKLIQEPFSGNAGDETYDAIFASYCLSMINPGFDAVIEAAVNRLNPGGFLAVVDFHDAAFPLFKSWMRVNHVEMESHLLKSLKSVTTPELESVRPAYGGVWEYVTYIGRKR